MLITPQQIKTRRINLGLSQMELAEKLTVSQNTIARLERGELEPEHPGMLVLAFQALEQAFIKPQTEAQLAKRRKEILALGKKIDKDLKDLAQENLKAFDKLLTNPSVKELTEQRLKDFDKLI